MQNAVPLRRLPYLVLALALAALGRVLDQIADFPGGTEDDFYNWLDAVLAPPAIAGKMTNVSPSETSV